MEFENSIIDDFLKYYCNLYESQIEYIGELPEKIITITKSGEIIGL